MVKGLGLRRSLAVLLALVWVAAWALYPRSSADEPPPAAFGGKAAPSPAPDKTERARSVPGPRAAEGLQRRHPLARPPRRPARAATSSPDRRWIPDGGVWPPIVRLLTGAQTTEGPGFYADSGEPVDDLPAPPVIASGLVVESIRPRSAVVRFTTDLEVVGVVGFGWDDPVSFASDELGLEHRIELHGLVPDTGYVVHVLSHSGDEQPEVEFETEPPPLAPDAAIADGRVELDGEPYFPVVAYGACPWTLDNLLAAGVNLFQWEHSCGAAAGAAGDALLESIESLGDQAYWTLPWDDRDLAADGNIGFTQTDEPDGLGLDPADLPDIDEPDKVSFLTLTQHFAPGTGQLPWQVAGYYEALAGKADVLGVDFYPLQGLCSPEKLALNHDVQVELLKLGEGKPTFQWIESAWMNCPERADAAITPQTLRAEMLLAVAGGANGLGVFPSRLGLAAALAIRDTLDTIEQAWPMLMSERLPVEIVGADAPLVRASARLAGDATMVVVANADRTRRAAVDLRLPGVEDGQDVVSVDRFLEATVEDGIVHLELAPLEAHILVAVPDPVQVPEVESPDETPQDLPAP